MTRDAKTIRIASAIPISDRCLSWKNILLIRRGGMQSANGRAMTQGSLASLAGEVNAESIKE